MKVNIFSKLPCGPTMISWRKILLSTPRGGLRGVTYIGIIHLTPPSDFVLFNSADFWPKKLTWNLKFAKLTFINRHNLFSILLRYSLEENSVQDVWWRRNPETYRNVVFLRKIYNYIICILKGLTNEASFYVFLSIKNFNVYKSFFQVKKLIGMHFMVPMKRKRLK